MSDPVRALVANAQAEITRNRELHEDAMDHVGLPGSTVHVLHDGRKGWMHGESGTVVWANSEWAEVLFKDGRALRFKLERLSRQPDGKSCWNGRAESLWYAAGTRTGR